MPQRFAVGLTEMSRTIAVIAQLTDGPHMLDAVDQQLQRVVGTQARVSVPFVCIQKAWGWWSEGSPTQGAIQKPDPEPDPTHHFLFAT